MNYFHLFFSLLLTIIHKRIDVFPLYYQVIVLTNLNLVFQISEYGVQDIKLLAVHFGAMLEPADEAVNFIPAVEAEWSLLKCSLYARYLLINCS